MNDVRKNVDTGVFKGDELAVKPNLMLLHIDETMRRPALTADDDWRPNVDIVACIVQARRSLLSACAGPVRRISCGKQCADALRSINPAPGRTCRSLRHATIATKVRQLGPRLWRNQHRTGW